MIEVSVMTDRNTLPSFSLTTAEVSFESLGMETWARTTGIEKIDKNICVNMF